MPEKYPLPRDAMVAEMFKTLFGDGVLVKRGTPLDTKGQGTNLVAVFVADDGSPATAVVCDVSFGAYAGCALSMIPAAGARDAAKSGELSDLMHENLREVMNICSRFFMTNESPHIRLETVYPTSEVAPVGALSLLTRPGQQLDLDITIPGYGSGRVTLLTA